MKSFPHTVGCPNPKTCGQKSRALSSGQRSLPRMRVATWQTQTQTHGSAMAALQVGHSSQSENSLLLLLDEGASHMDDVV